MLKLEDFRCMEIYLPTAISKGSTVYAYKITHRACNSEQRVLVKRSYPAGKLPGLPSGRASLVLHSFYRYYLSALPSGTISTPKSGAKADIDEWMDLVRAASSGTLPASNVASIDDWSIAPIITDLLTKQGCQHEYKAYQGFNESYDYCIKCDHKKVGV